MKCKKCKSIEATIHVANVGDFCLDCHNDYMAELLGVSKMDDFSKIISGYPDFPLKRIIYPNIFHI